jgi:hypothetical protein
VADVSHAAAAGSVVVVAPPVPAGTDLPAAAHCQHRGDDGGDVLCVHPEPPAEPVDLAGAAGRRGARARGRAGSRGVARALAAGHAAAGSPATRDAPGAGRESGRESDLGPTAGGCRDAADGRPHGALPSAPHPSSARTPGPCAPCTCAPARPGGRAARHAHSKGSASIPRDRCVCRRCIGCS